MVAVLDRLGGSPLADVSDANGDDYRCDCPGFKVLDVMQMCLRCLEAYSTGLPHVLQGVGLHREMHRVATRLAVILRDDPLLANLPLSAAIRAAER